jgi:hypothetical protein
MIASAYTSTCKLRSTPVEYTSDRLRNFIPDLRISGVLLLQTILPFFWNHNIYLFIYLELAGSKNMNNKQKYAFVLV